MAPAARLCVLPLRPTASRTLSRLAGQPHRALHRPASQPAKVVPIYGTGPPPEPPTPIGEHSEATARLARRKRQADLLSQAKDARAVAAARNAGGSKARQEGTAPPTRFWKDVTVKEVDGAYEIHLDKHALRHPTTKTIVRIPLSKPTLATALAIEWDQLVSAQDATRQHLIPLTSLVCRALDITHDDARHASNTDAPGTPIRTTVATSLMRYLDTDSLLCWVPPVDRNDPTNPASTYNDAGQTLRDVQEEATKPIVSFLTTRVWPGITLVPVLEGGSLMPRRQEPGVREVVQGWVLGLSAWELAGLERATLGGKSLLVAARLLVEWSDGKAGAVVRNGVKPTFGVEEAARVASLEVSWQTGRWGEVEDTHDVEKVDVRRQMGSVVLLVSGTGAAGPTANL